MTEGLTVGIGTGYLYVDGVAQGGIPNSLFYFLLSFLVNSIMGGVTLVVSNQFMSKLLPTHGPQIAVEQFSVVESADLHGCTTIGQL